MSFCVYATEVGKPPILLETCGSRSAALPLLKYHRDRLQEAHPFDTIWLRDDVNTDAYYLVYRKVYAMGASLTRLKERKAFLYRLDISSFIE